MTDSNCCCQECPGACPECTRVHVNFCAHPDTHASIVAAAEATRVSVKDFFIDAAWQRVLEHRDQAALDQHFHRFFKS